MRAYLFSVENETGKALLVKEAACVDHSTAYMLFENDMIGDLANGRVEVEKEEHVYNDTFPFDSEHIIKIFNECGVERIGVECDFTGEGLSLDSNIHAITTVGMKCDGRVRQYLIVCALK